MFLKGCDVKPKNDVTSGYDVMGQLFKACTGLQDGEPCHHTSLELSEQNEHLVLVVLALVHCQCR